LRSDDGRKTRSDAATEAAFENALLAAADVVVPLPAAERDPIGAACYRARWYAARQTRLRQANVNR
jgi:hypothetical protein